MSPRGYCKISFRGKVKNFKTQNSRLFCKAIKRIRFDFLKTPLSQFDPPPRKWTNEIWKRIQGLITKFFRLIKPEKHPGVDLEEMSEESRFPLKNMEPSGCSWWFQGSLASVNIHFYFFSWGPEGSKSKRIQELSVELREGSTGSWNPLKSAPGFTRPLRSWKLKKFVASERRFTDDVRKSMTDFDEIHKRNFFF